jgi:hypothetical protein
LHMGTAPEKLHHAALTEHSLCVPCNWLRNLSTTRISPFERSIAFDKSHGSGQHRDRDFLRPTIYSLTHEGFAKFHLEIFACRILRHISEAAGTPKSGSSILDEATGPVLSGTASAAGYDATPLVPDLPLHAELTISWCLFHIPQEGP